jgi:hypothetical protein
VVVVVVVVPLLQSKQVMKSETQLLILNHDTKVRFTRFRYFNQ